MPSIIVTLASEFTKKKSSKAAALTLLVSHSAVLMAAFLAPYSESAQDRSHPFIPPMGLHFIDSAGAFHARPFVQDESGGHALRFFVHGTPYRILGLLPSDIHLFGLDEPVRIFLLGSDGYGRDQLSRILFGGQISLAVGILATSLSLTIGLAVGLFAGYWGGWRDEIAMRVADLFMGLPWLYLLLALRAFLPLTFSPTAAFLALFAMIGVLGWARPARLIRGVALSLKERPYVMAARGFGARDSYLIARHILPDISGILWTQAALLAPQYILAEVTLSYLGLGMGEPAASLGTMLASLREISVMAAYWWMALPALALLPVFYAYHILAQTFQEMTLSRS